MNRVSVYIDGFNLYFGLKDSGFKRFYWLDLVALATAFVRPGSTLEHVHYFTARIRSTGTNDASIQRQAVYLDALATLPSLTIHYGHFLVKNAHCKRCGSNWPTFEEKMSDVNLAVQLVLDACDDRFDTAIIVSGDSDLTTPIRRIRARFPAKRVLIAFPPMRNSASLQAEASNFFRIGADKLRNSQLPDPVVTPSGITLARPGTWK